MIRIEHCCFFIPMQTGAYILGVYSILIGVFYTTSYFIDRDGSLIPALTICCAILAFVSGIFLIIGTYWTKSKLVFAWIILQAISLNLEVIMVVVSIVAVGFHNGIILYIASAVLTIYFILCMLSFHHDLGGSIEIPE